MLKFTENQNPDAKIAFLAWNPFHYYVYKNIAKHLPEAEYVVCDTWYQTIWDRGPKHLEKTIDILNKNKCYWWVITELNDTSLIKNFFDKYEIIVAVHSWPPLSAVLTKSFFQHKKLVRVLYGNAKGLVTFAPWSAFFDIVLTYGPYTQEHIAPINISHAIGNPKFDDWFDQSIDPDSLKQIRNNLDPAKKTLLYLPTHSGLSSLHMHGKNIKLLGDRFNILVKLHHLNKLTEKEIVREIMEDPRILAFDEEDDILPLFHLADVIVSDSSSAALEALLVDKPMVILDPASNQEAQQKHAEGEEFNGYWYSGGLEYAEGAGHKLRQLFSKFQLVVQSANDLEPAIHRALGTSWNLFKSERDEFCNYIFAHRDGKSGKRAADIIRDFLTRPKPTPPILGAAIRAYLPNLELNYKLGIQRMDQAIKKRDLKIRELEKKLLLYQEIKKEHNFLKKTQLIMREFLHDWS